MVLNGQHLAGKAYSLFAELDIPIDGPLRLADAPGGDMEKRFAKWSTLIPQKSGAARCVTYADPSECAEMKLGDIVEPWSAPHWDTVNYYRDTTGIGLGKKVLQVDRSEHEARFGDLSTTGTLVDSDGRFLTFEIAAEGGHSEAPKPAYLPAAPEAPALPYNIGMEGDRFTWGGCYFRTLEQAIEYAERHEGTQPAFSARIQPTEPPAKAFKWWLWGPIAAAVALFAYGAATGPKTYADVAEMEYKSCMRSQGDGHWRASSGVKLETFCRAAGNTEARRGLCKTHPEAC